MQHDILTNHRRETRHKVRFAEWGLLAILLLVLIAALEQWGTTVRLDRLVQDASIRLQYRPPHPDIVVVAIDEQSIAAIGRWPWRRVSSMFETVLPPRHCVLKILSIALPFASSSTSLSR